MSDKELSDTQKECVRLLDAVLDMAVQGNVVSVGIVIVTEPGKFRVSAAGNDIDGLTAGTAKMHEKLLEALHKEVEAKKPKPKLVIMK